MYTHSHKVNSIPKLAERAPSLDLKFAVSALAYTIVLIMRGYCGYVVSSGSHAHFYAHRVNL